MENLNELKKILDDLESPIYLAGHVTPDHDSIGSCLALGRLLQKLGKEVYVLLESFDKDISAIHGNKEMIVNDVTHEKFNFIAMDLNQTYRLARYEEYFDKANYTINIDHHQGNKTNADYVLSISNISSSCEIVYNIIKLYGEEFFEEEVCKSLYTGIMTDTSCFERRLSSNTLVIAQDLINRGVDYDSIIKKTFAHRTLYELKALGEIIDEIKFEGFHYAVMDKSLDCYKNLTHNQIMKTIAEEMRKLEAMDVFLLLIKDGKEITAKCMSNVSKNADVIAKLFGGGGHKGEAGFNTNKLSVEKIVARVKDFLTSKKVTSEGKSKVYFTKDISSTGLLNMYKAMGRDLDGNVAVKISTGEPGGHNFLQPSLIAPLIDELDGTIVECCTAYKGRRFDPEEHWKVLEEHGFKAIAPCDIMDEMGEVRLAVKGGKHLKGYNIVGKSVRKYDSMLMLSHFKGHQMGGFGGALKNMSIGLASRNGKAWIHSWGNTKNVDEMWGFTDNQDAFLESMAEACKSVVDYYGSDNIVYINVANRLSIDCDCNAHPAEPEMADIGIFASVDPVALDQCCYDAIINSTDEGKQSLIDRMNDRNAIHLVEEAERLGLGSREYTIINLD